MSVGGKYLGLATSKCLDYLYLFTEGFSSHHACDDF